ncbi:MAG: hypothetical protein JSU08_01720 [Acidobacteria bacterium]|nr:hypothetical protein [Acidobacteriota bacterium]
MIRAAIDWARRTVLAGNPAESTPGTLHFLLQECTRHDDPALRHAIERGLTHALDAGPADADPCRRIEWLHLLATAAPLCDDERLEAVARRALPDAIDRLEHHVRRSYEPGDGLVGADRLAHLRCARALLAAFDMSGRLPYAMLAEELLRYTTRVWGHAQRLQSGGADGFLSDCAELDVATRLAVLHADPDYAAAAVTAPGRILAADLRQHAEATAATAQQFPDHAGEAGHALSAWFAFEADLH